jgi:hypothetical protein
MLGGGRSRHGLKVFEGRLQLVSRKGNFAKEQVSRGKVGSRRQDFRSDLFGYFRLASD